MQVEIEEVLALQPAWTWRNTPQMERRGVVVRTEMARWLRDELPALSELVPAEVEDLAVEGRDGTGRKTRVRWVRVFSKARSPSATEGFYVVYLFDAAGRKAYLSLGRGDTLLVVLGDLPVGRGHLSAVVDELRPTRGQASDGLSEQRQVRLSAVE